MVEGGGEEAIILRGGGETRFAPTIEDALLWTHYWRHTFGEHTIEDTLLRTHYWRYTFENTKLKTHFWEHTIEDTLLENTLLKIHFWEHTTEDTLLDNTLLRHTFGEHAIKDAILRTLLKTHIWPILTQRMTISYREQPTLTCGHSNSPRSFPSEENTATWNLFPWESPIRISPASEFIHR